MPGQFEEIACESLAHELRQWQPLPDKGNSCRDDDERRSRPRPDVMQARAR